MKIPNTNTNTKKSNKECLKISSFSVIRARILDSGSVVADLKINGITIYGCFVVQTEKGEFISLPQRKGSDGKYYSIVWAVLSKQDTEDIIKEIEKKLNE